MISLKKYDLDTKNSINFISKNIYNNNYLDNSHKYIYINDVINNWLLANSESGNFKNAIFIKIEGYVRENDPNKILTGYCIKSFVNDSNLN